MKRFWDKVKKQSGVYGIDGTHDTQCWVWTASLKNGYGEIWHVDKRHYAHRLSWFLEHGEWPDPLCVLHKCDNRQCVRPDHLFLGTKGDNNRDTVCKGRHKGGGPPGELCGASKLTEQTVLAIREGYQEGCSQRALARQHNTSKSAVGAIVRRETWRHI